MLQPVGEYKLVETRRLAGEIIFTDWPRTTPAAEGGQCFRQRPVCLPGQQQDRWRHGHCPTDGWRYDPSHSLTYSSPRINEVKVPIIAYKITPLPVKT